MIEQSQRKREMKGQVNHKVDRRELAPGDHIYVYHKAYLYSHHGIFVGENTIINYNRNAEGSSSSPPRSSGLISSFFRSTILASSEMILQSTCSNCRGGLRGPGNGVVSSCLDCFIGKKKLRRYQYGVSRKDFEVKPRGGTCTAAMSDPLEEVIRRARYLLKVGFGNYNLGNNNCEDFALYCKTGLLIRNEEGLGSSGQINTLPAIFTSVGDRLSAKELPRMYYSRRYSSDIGVRNDVVKVAVEDVASFLIARRERCSNSEPPQK